MLTLITGTPGAGKTLYAVWELARKVPGSTIEATAGVAVKRRLLTNIKDLLVEHELIGAKDLETWHEWSQPGDVIIFDEVQEVWRPRSVGSKVPECIAALETHRHKGVDMVLITQHPMLVDSNIRRLVNQHIHVRRLPGGITWQYEWDHCGQPGQYKTCTRNALWRYPREGFKLYKSAQLHTKPTTRVPALLWVGIAAIAGLAYMGPVAYARITNTFSGQKTETAAATAPTGAASAPKRPASQTGGQASGLPPAPPVAQVVATAPDPAPTQSRPQFMGCISFKERCECFDPGGARVVVPMDVCREGAQRLSFVVGARETVTPRPAGTTRSEPVPPSSDFIVLNPGRPEGTGVKPRGSASEVTASPKSVPAS